MKKILEDEIKKIVEETVILTLKKTGTLDVGKSQIPDTMSPEQLAEYLGMSINWVYQHTKELPHEKRGRKTLFIKLEIDSWRLQQREEKELKKQKAVSSYSNDARGLYKVV